MPKPHVAPPGRRERNKARNRGELLRAARSVFAELGYEATTVRDITRRTDLASGTFYQYFRDKRAVFAALEHDMEVAFVRAMRTPRRDRTLSLRERIRRSFLAVFAFAAAEPEYFRLFQTSMLEPPKLRRAIAELRADLFPRSRRDPAEADLMCAAILGVGCTVARHAIDDPRQTPERAARLGTDWVLKMLT
jgi:AcrR family transcriptional regulator